MASASVPPIPTGPPTPEQISSHPDPHPSSGAVTPSPSSAAGPQLAQPRADFLYITFRGYGTSRVDLFSVMCGDEPPTVTDGYAKWTTVDRPLHRGVTIFQGYNPAKMSVNVRFGTWDGMCGAQAVSDASPDSGWGIDNDGSGQAVEQDIERLEWMAGAHFPSGQPPMVYVNTIGPHQGSTNLIPFEYQSTTNSAPWDTDPSAWPWVITSLKWGKSLRSRGGNRLYQEAALELTNFQGLSKPPTKQKAGHYFTTTPTARSMIQIANVQNPKPQSTQGAAKAIQQSPKNNPMHHSSIHLTSKMLNWKIPPGKQVWVPAYNYPGK